MLCAKSIVRRLWVPVLIALSLTACAGGSSDSSGNAGISVAGASKVYIGGQFSSVDSQARSNAAAVDSDGTLLSWAPSPYGKVTALAASGSTVYTGGEFTMFDAQTRNRLAAINADGTLSTTWNPGADSTVDTLVASGNTVYAGGLFTSVGGTTRNYLAAIDTDGTLNSWDPGTSDFWTSYDAEVNALSISGGELHVGGYFYGVGGDLSPCYLTVTP